MDRKHVITTLSVMAVLGAVGGFGKAFAGGVPANTNIAIPDANFSLIYGPGYATNNSVGGYGTGGALVSGEYGLPGTAGPKTGTTAGGMTATDTSGLGLTTIYAYQNNSDTPQTMTYTNGSGSGTYSVSGFNNAYIPDWSGQGAAMGAGNYAPLYVNSGLFGQVLNTAVAPNTTYLLTATVHSTGQGSNPPILELTAGSSSSYSANAVLQGGVYYGAPGAAGQPGAAVSELVTTGANASGNLGITLGASGLQSVFSNVTLTANPTTLPTGASYSQPAYVNNGIVISNGGPFAPAPGAADQSNLSPTGTASYASPNYGVGKGTTPAINYYTNNTAAPGQTFTTGTNAAGYKLNAITVSLSDAGNGAFNDGNSVNLEIATVNSTNGTYQLLELVNGVIATGTAIGQGNYITISLKNPLTLKAGSMYGYAISTPNGYAGLTADSAAGDYTGGQLAEFNPGTGFGGTLITNPNVPQSVFDVSLTPVAATPEPASLALLAIGGLAVLLKRRQRA